MAPKQNGSSECAVVAELQQSWSVFDRARRLACALFDGADAMIVIVDGATIWRSHDPDRLLPADAPAAQACVKSRELLWVEDCRKHPRFKDGPGVVGWPFVRLYAAAPIRLADGSIPGVLAINGAEPRAYDENLASRLQDLADFVSDEWARLRAESARETAARERDAANSTLAAVIDAAPLSIAVTDKAMRLLHASPRWLEDSGLALEEALGGDIYALVDSYQSYREVFDRCLKGRRFRGAKVPTQRADGSIGWMQAFTGAWRDPSGEIGGLILIHHDITETIETLERLARSEERLKLAVEIADLHVFELDFVRKEVVKAGPEDVFFSTPQTFETAAEDVWHLVDPRDRPTVVAAWEAYVTEGVPYRPEFRMARSDGREVWTAGRGRLISDETGAAVRLIAALQNITARKAQEQALIHAKEEAEAANRAKSAFLATMSHEIRTPLNGVLGMAQAMEMGELDPAQAARLQVIRESGEALLAILNDLLDLSKIEAGKFELEDGEFDLTELARGAHATFSAVADAKGVEFDLKVLPSARGCYRGDSVRVRQILYNLVSNALKFTERGSVRVTVGRRAGKLTLRVADTGIGMHPDHVRRLFKPFEQADASTTRRYGGTGLGLAICRDLAELMGGQISARSSEGEGTTFTVSLPLEKVAARAVESHASQEPEAHAERLRPLRVLAAEDNSVNQLVLKTLLNQLGIEPTIVVDGRAAVDAWAREYWDVILMDVQMPLMDGLAATMEIRAREKALARPRTPIVALTANAMGHHVSEYRAIGMDGYVAKPIEAARLFAALEAVLADAAPGGAEAAA